MQGIFGRVLGGLAAFYLTIGFITTFFTGNIGTSTFSSLDGFVSTGIATLAWPVPFGSFMCDDNATNSDVAIKCNGLSTPFGDKVEINLKG